MKLPVATLRLLSLQKSLQNHHEKHESGLSIPCKRILINVQLFANTLDIKCYMFLFKRVKPVTQVKQHIIHTSAQYSVQQPGLFLYPFRSDIRFFISWNLFPI